MSDATTARYWRERRAVRRLLAALVLGPLTAALLAIGILGALDAGCYATTTPVQTCAENPHQEGCLAPIHDSKRPDGGQ